MTISDADRKDVVEKENSSAAGNAAPLTRNQ